MTNLVLKLADSVQSLGVKSTYGESLEVNGTTVIPVSAHWFGFGGGSEGASNDGEGDDSAGGGGGGGASIPFGAYVGDDEGVYFAPNPVALLAVAIPAIWVTGKALSRIIRALKK